VENGITVPQLESVLFEFVGCKAVSSEGDVRRLVSNSGVPTESVDGVVDHLVRLSFLGEEVGEGVFVYSDEPRELRKNKVLCDRYLERSGGVRRYEINPPFRSYLEIDEDSGVQQSLSV
jgi:hypothetical protein